MAADFASHATHTLESCNINLYAYILYIIDYNCMPMCMYHYIHTHVYIYIYILLLLLLLLFLLLSSLLHYQYYYYYSYHYYYVSYVVTQCYICIWNLLVDDVDVT